VSLAHWTHWTRELVRVRALGFVACWPGSEHFARNDDVDRGGAFRGVRQRHGLHYW
jgi:hypothetical protein